MGKKDKKKQGLGAAKTAAKTAKKEQKAAAAALKASGEEDVEAILADILAAEAAAVAVTEAIDVPPPSPRVNGTLVPHPTREGELLVFGGEHFDGARTSFFSDTYTYAPAKGVWSLYTSPTRPPPRSAAAAASYRGHLYLFGGEFASPSGGQFHHFKDLWRLDGATMSWERLELRGGPSPRSGHRLAVSKGRLLVFGGFYDTLRETRYMNDLYVLDLNADELKWSSPTTTVTDVVPSPRSGFQWVVDDADGSVVLYGGFCKAPPPKKSGRAHAVGKGKKGAKGGGSAAASLAAEEAYDGRGTVMTDAFRLRPDNLTWARVKKGGYAPSARAGFGLLPHKRLAVLFGGVEDEEGADEELVSRFHADLFALNLDRGKWHPLTLRPPKSAKAAAAAAARRKRRKGRRKAGGGARGEEGRAALVAVERLPRALVVKPAATTALATAPLVVALQAVAAMTRRRLRMRRRSATRSRRPLVGALTLGRRCLATPSTYLAGWLKRATWRSPSTTFGRWTSPASTRGRVFSR